MYPAYSRTHPIAPTIIFRKFISTLSECSKKRTTMLPQSYPSQMPFYMMTEMALFASATCQSALTQASPLHLSAWTIWMLPRLWTTSVISIGTTSSGTFIQSTVDPFKSHELPTIWDAPCLTFYLSNAWHTHWIGQPTYCSHICDRHNVNYFRRTSHLPSMTWMMISQKSCQSVQLHLSMLWEWCTLFITETTTHLDTQSIS